MTSKITNTVKEAIGATKEKLGHATHNENLAASGAAQSSQAHADKQAHANQTHAGGVGHNLGGPTHTHAGGVGHNLGGTTHAGDVGHNFGGTTQTHASGIGHNIEGAAQKTVGHATNNPSLADRGHVNAAVGDAQRNV
ncbi:hypothetical protein BGX27_011446 [Mortierella sp. AM989]|nr:hypothetical protein BGX27_011446 [Mortierella sp. AM989]